MVFSLIFDLEKYCIHNEVMKKKNAPVKKVVAKKALVKKENVNLKKVGLFFLIFPALFILTFLIGEVAGGSAAGMGHIFQIVPLILFALIASKYPYIGGLILYLVGVILTTLYTIQVGLRYPLVDILLFVPLVISGVLLVISSRTK